MIKEFSHKTKSQAMGRAIVIVFLFILVELFQARKQLTKINKTLQE
ncbi:hypothetical protein GOQ27_13085 [Clostridium sp. D2Q-11]|uniref:Uncharacterized protein n=1 Tax=Anaeromonas frigoriresistens TaxID=2683708 RepID=A0A942UZ03_9FIRM|nr:hypothetical protein [Anaeromonas frigoriresistens]MBS4539404.1 hypothetical protein [Anaeromonas frigoriresistens]